MTIEDQITALLAEAEPLRLLPDEEAEAKGLPGIVERINALRAIEQSAERNDPFKPASGISQILDVVVPAKRKPGPKPKAKIEGADA